MRLRGIVIAVMSFFLTACGGGGGSGGSATQQQPAGGGTVTTVSLNGQWAGTYAVTSQLRGVALYLANSGSSVSGTFVTDTGVTGNLAGSLNGNNLVFTMTSTTPACPGSYSGSGAATDAAINFTYSGSDCVGTYANKQGSLNKLNATGTAGWSGNWWYAGTDHYTIISLTTQDSVAYVGTLKTVNVMDGSTLTADLSGTATALTMANISGRLYVNYVPTSGTVTFGSPNGDRINLSLNFAFSGGSYYTGGQFQRVP